MMFHKGCGRRWLWRLPLAALMALLIRGECGAAGEPAVSSEMEAPVIFAIKVQGNRLTSRQFIQREMLLKVGMPATPERVAADRVHLLSLGVFNRVEITIVQDEGRAVLNVRISEPFYLYPLLILSWDPDQPEKRTYGLILYHNNFRGLGAKLGGSFWQGTSRGFTLFHHDPWFSFGGSFGLDADLQYNQGEIRDTSDAWVDRDLRSGDIIYRQRLGLQSWLDVSAGWMDISAGNETYTLSPGRRDRVGSIGASVWSDHRDYRFYPTRGILFSVGATASRVVDIPHNYFRESAEFRRYRSFGGPILAWRVTGSVAQGELPQYQLLSVNSSIIRAGEAYQFGGGGFVATNLEFRFNIVPMRYFSFTWVPLMGGYLENLKFSVEGVTFGDLGAAFDPDERIMARFRAVGAGLQFQVPFLECLHILSGWTPRDPIGKPSINIGIGVTY